MRESVQKQHSDPGRARRDREGSAPSAAGSMVSIAHLQRRYGNQAVMRLIGTEKGPALQKKCAPCALGKGLCPKCAEEEPALQRRSAPLAEPTAIPSSVGEVLRSPGQPLDPGTRAFFEPRFGADFSQVRVHTDSKAAESARAVNALAYTVGRDLVFGVGQYAPGATAGRRLLAHELTHVVQQGPSGGTTLPQAKLEISDPSDAAEQAADRVAHRIGDGDRGQGRSHLRDVHVQRSPIRLQRLGANPGCTDPERRTIHGAIYNARGWLNKAIPKLEASPLSATALSSLRRNFGPTYGVAANAPLIVGRLRTVYGEISTIPFRCAGVADATCAALHCGYADAGAGGHSATICTNATLTAGTDWRFQAGCVLHESFHAAFSGFTAARDSYSGWHGVAGATPGYPGAGVDPLLNADTYTTLVMDLS